LRASPLRTGARGSPSLAFWPKTVTNGHRPGRPNHVARKISAGQ
jgi:hypothetical protein